MIEEATPKEKKTLLLLFDGHALIHRAFHALPPLTQSRTGEMVNAVYGFASTLLKTLADFKPTYCAIAFDPPGPTFRHEMFHEYKAQRPATPDELRGQMNKVRQLVEAFHIPIFEINGFEADDVLGTLSRQASEQGVETIIVTGDKDMFQVVLPLVKILTPRRTFSDTILYNEAAVEQKHGVKPEQIADLKALAGDASDNIPGVPGIGEKTAARLIQQYGSIEQIYTHIDDVTPDKLQMALREHRSQAFQSKTLATIVRDVPIELDLINCHVSHFDRDEVVKLFQELEFINLLPRLPQEKADNRQPPAVKYHLVNTSISLEQLITELEATQDIAIEIETTGKEAISCSRDMLVFTR